MSKIPSIVYNTTLRTYRPRDKEMVVVSEKKAADPFGFGKQFTHAKLMSNLSVRGFMQKQDEYRTQIVNYNIAAQELSSASDILTSPTFLEERNIDISDNESFINPQVNHHAKIAKYELEVTQLAAHQVNEGRLFPKNAPRELPAGIYTLGIEVYNQDQKQVSVYIAENDTTIRVLQKFTSVINAGGSEVAAQIKKETNGNFIYLKAGEPGVKGSFTIRDIHGNAAEALGLNHVTESALNNIYRLNGVRHESASNTISFDDDNIILTAQAPSLAQINIVKNYDKPIDAVRSIAAQYNNLKDVLSTDKNLSSRGEKLLNGMRVLVGNIQKKDLRSIGISIDEKTNLMVVDETKLRRNMNNNPETVKRILSEKPGLGTISKNLAQTIRDNPLSNFLKTPTMLDSIDYGWRWRSAGSIGIISLGVFAAFNQGMFFDKFI